MPVIVFFELGIALLLIIGVWGWLRWHRPPVQQEATKIPNTPDTPPTDSTT